MSIKRVLRHAETGREYEVVSVDEARGIVTLRGELAEFTEPLDWERFKSMGYKRKTVEVNEDRGKQH
jgi:hypothetical protein